MKPIRASNRATNSKNASRLTWAVRNAASSQAEIDIFDTIGDPWDGTSAKDFVQELRGISAKNIRLNINSPGGFVDDALAMYDAILEHPADITAHITVAASAASFVAMAANKRVISKNGKMQIHDGQGLVFIVDMMNVEAIDAIVSDLAIARATLDEESNNIASIYADHAGGTAADWRKKMQANGANGTTYRGQEAVDVGLCDEVAAIARNEAPMRVAAHVEPEPDPEEPAAVLIDIDLIPPLAHGYEKPLPADLTRLITANLPATKG